MLLNASLRILLWKQSVCPLELSLQRHLLTDGHKWGLNSSSCQSALLAPRHWHASSVPPPPRLSASPAVCKDFLTGTIIHVPCANLGVYFTGYHYPNKIVPVSLLTHFFTSGWHIRNHLPSTQGHLLGAQTNVSSIRPSLISPPGMKCFFLCILLTRFSQYFNYRLLLQKWAICIRHRRMPPPEHPHGAWEWQGLPAHPLRAC